MSPHSVEEGMMLWGVVLLFLAVGAWFLWWRFHGLISATVMHVQHWQMQQFARFTDSYVALDSQVVQTDPDSVRFGTLWRLTHNVGSFLHYPAAALVAVLGIWCLLRASTTRFTRNIDLPKLMEIQAEVFPGGAAFVGRGLKLTNIEKGAPRPCDPALHADEWISRFALGSDGAMNEDRAAVALTQQLGPVWGGLKQASPQVRCLFAVFALHAARKREAAVTLLGTLARSLPIDAKDGPNGPAAPLAFGTAAVAEADRVLGDGSLTKRCEAVARRHAYTAPMLMSVLSLARREAGVLAPAQFAFLKLVDRPLWYALHSLGFPGGQNPAEQPNPRIEAAGARDHWAAECSVGHPLPVPSFERSLAVVRKKAVEKGLDKPSTLETTR
jgi:intracellular multiplication protein IcmP